MKLTIATCQFPVSRDIGLNLQHVLSQMRRASEGGADVAHFSEACLSGYAGIDVPSFSDHYPWDALVDSTRHVQALARSLRLWVILGSAHRLSGRNKPHNSLYIINSRGQCIDRYDKRFCTGNRSCRTGDLKHYTSGDHTAVFTIKGVRCGALICHDFRYQELYRDSKQRGVRVMFHSFYNVCRDRKAVLGESNIWAVIVPPTLQTYAANNHMWISATNSASKRSSWPSFFVQPEGRITGRLHRGKAGVLISTVDTKARLYDASVYWRDRAIQGVYHSGNLVRDDPRSEDRVSV